ncbi:hypothetical protein AgCh_016651 [Apium graveolens]
MSELVRDYFTRLFTWEVEKGAFAYKEGVKTVSRDQNVKLIEEFNFEEFTTAVKQKNPNKSAGPDRGDEEVALKLDISKAYDRELERLFNNYWWISGKAGKRGINWHSWRNMGLPKSKGGLGFRDLYGFNIALLGKHCWNFMSNPTSFVSRLFKARYFPTTHVLKAVKGQSASFIWSGIWLAKEELKKGFKWVLGNRVDIVAIKDQWLRNKRGFSVKQSHRYEGRSEYVSSLFNAGSKCWNVSLAKSMFVEEDATTILANSIPQREVKYRIAWTGMGNVQQHQGWSKVWKLNLPHKVPCSIFEGEAISVYEALSWIADQQLQDMRIYVESDSQLTVRAIQIEDVNYLKVGVVIESCFQKLQHLEHVSLSFIRRNANSKMNKKDVGVKIPFLDKDNYHHWKVKMHLHLLSQDEAYVDCIERGPHVPMRAATRYEPSVPKSRLEWFDPDIEQVRKDKKAMNILFNGVDRDMFDNIINCKTAKDVWDTIQIICDGTEQVRENKMQLLIQQYEHFHNEESESLTDIFSRFQKLLNALKLHGRVYQTKDSNLKFLRSLPKEWKPMTVSLRNSQDYKEFTLERLYGVLKTYELEI